MQTCTRCILPSCLMFLTGCGAAPDAVPRGARGEEVITNSLQ